MSANISSSFRSHDSFNLFLFSRTKDNQIRFLLRKKQKTADFAHFNGLYTNNEPSLMLAVGRNFIRKTNGLLCTPNLKYFSAENPILLESSNIVLERDPKSIKPAKTLSVPLNDICQQVCESPFFFQDASNTATYFVEIPMLDIQKLDEFSQSRAITHKFEYFTLEEMLIQRSEDVARGLKELLLDNHELRNYLIKYIINNEPIETTESYGVICCEMFLKSYLLHALHFPIFKKHGESWRFYKAHEKDLPTDEELKKLKGLIIPGSSMSASNCNVDWYPAMFELIRKVNAQYTDVNLLGICFGAQIIAQALGGKVEKMPRDFVCGGEVLKVKPEFYELPFVKNSNLDAAKQLVIAQAHNDHIVELPPMAKHYGSSETTNVEIFTINHNILAFQGHPDYNEVMVVRSSMKKTDLSVRNYAKYEEERIKSKFPTALTQNEVLKICYNFLKQKV